MGMMPGGATSCVDTAPPTHAAAMAAVTTGDDSDLADGGSGTGGLHQFCEDADRGALPLPPTVFFFQLPVKRSKGFVVDIGAAMGDASPSSRGSASATSPPTSPTKQSWWSWASSAKKRSAASVELERARLEREFRGVPIAEIHRARRHFEQAAASDASSDGKGGTTVRWEALPALLARLGLRTEAWCE